MALLTQAELVAQLLDSAKRMREVRAAAEILTRNRLGNEPDPRTPDTNLVQPLPRFSGQSERPNSPTG